MREQLLCRSFLLQKRLQFVVWILQKVRKLLHCVTVLQVVVRQVQSDQMGGVGLQGREQMNTADL